MKQITIQEIKEALNHGWNMTDNDLACAIADILFQLANYKEKDSKGLMSQRLSKIYRDEANELCEKLESVGYYNRDNQ